MRSLVVGMGNIGKAVCEVISPYEDKLYTYDIAYSTEPDAYYIDVLHICFPYSPDFLGQVISYIEKYKAMHVAIWSTVPIGTTAKILGAVHTPVEGRHPELTDSIRSMRRWIGGNERSEVNFFASYFQQMNLAVKPVPNSGFTEFLKLRSTAKFGINLVWTDYEAEVAAALHMSFDLIKKFDADYNKLYHNIGMDWAQRYILDPPHGKIGGHCVVPNAELLDNQYPNELLKMIKEYK